MCMNFEDMVKCVNCNKQFHENEVIYDGDEDMEFCPYCGEGGKIRNLSNNEENDMKKIKFSMNVYYDADKIIKEHTNITQDVFDRMEVNDYHDIYNGIEEIEDEDVFNTIAAFIEKSTIEELKPFIAVNEDSIRFDKCESYECNYDFLAYLIDVTLDIGKILIEIKM